MLHLHVQIRVNLKIQDGRLGNNLYKTFRNTPMTDTQVRKILHHARYKTFPRPEGIPHNFRVQLTEKGCGMKYVHTSHTHESVRIMPGNPP